MTHPNVILLTVDGMRWDDAGALGNPTIRTPNLDALATHGLSFVQACACRAYGVEGRVAPFYAAPSTGGTGADPVAGPLQQAGYETGAVGVVKPVGHRYDQLAQTGDGVPVDAYASWLESAEPGIADTERGGDTLHVNTWIGNQAVRFCQSAQEPFFLWAGFSTAPGPPAPWRYMYPTKSLHLPLPPTGLPGEKAARDALSAHFGTVSHIDRQIGRVLATLTARGRTNNIILFTASQGSAAGYVGELDPYHDAYVRVPLIIGGYRGQRRGERDPALVSLADIPATVLEALALDGAATPGGQSVLPQLLRAGLPHRKAVPIALGGGARALRTARYKWGEGGAGGGEFLFDLQHDPGERENIGNTRPARALRKMLEGLAP